MGVLWSAKASHASASSWPVIASVFAVSRMLAMLTTMQLVPHHHFKLPGGLRIHTLIYTVVIAILLTIFFDLSRIASLRAIFYIVMDIGIHWGVFRYLRKDVGAKAAILIMAIVLDLVVLGAFVALAPRLFGVFSAERGLKQPLRQMRAHALYRPPSTRVSHLASRVSFRFASLAPDYKQKTSQACAT